MPYSTFEKKIGKVESLLALIHPENLRLLQANGLLRDAHRACSSAEIRRFQHLARTHQVNSMDDLTALAACCARENTILAAQTAQRPQQRY